jgi:uncharacterized membrane protein YfcA
MTPPEAVLLVGAGFVAGMVNAIAGGGTLVSFPALLAVGYPSITANVTNTIAIWPGYLGSAIGHRTEHGGSRRRVIVLGVTSVAGALTGAVILLNTPERVFRAVVPWLIAFAAILVAVQPRIAARVKALPGGAGEHRSALLHVGLFAGTVYSGYFGAGAGVLLIGVLGVFLPDSLRQINALRSALVLAVNTVVLVVFAFFGPVEWTAVALMSGASLAGGWTGASVARRLDARVLRTTIVVFAVVVAALLFVRG